jgi:hypothetical protein
MLFFSGNFDAFHGTETERKSLTYAGRARSAREKHGVSTGASGIKIKPRPRYDALTPTVAEMAV